MKTSRTRKVALLLFGLACMAPFAYAGEEEAIRTESGVSYVSGGVGMASRERLEAMAGEFNLKLIFTLESGAYLSGVTVVIADGSGKQLLRTLTDGPLLLAKLPTGNYHVAATLGDRRVERKIGLVADKGKVEYFRWTTE